MTVPDSTSAQGLLNANAPAIQAISAIVTTAVTIVLVLITRKYVALTKELADAAAGQLSYQQAAEIAKWHELWSLVKLLRRIVAELPDKDHRPALDSGIRQAIPWEEGDLSRFQALASQLGTLPGANAAIAVGSLRWLGERVSEVRAVPVQMGYDYDHYFPFNRWSDELDRARARIEDVAEAVKPKLQEPAVLHASAAIGKTEPK